MVSFWGLIAYGIGGVVVAGVALLVAFQEKLVYVPVLPGLAKAYALTPSRLRLAYEDVWLRSSDGVRLHSWFIRFSPNCSGPTILFFQENAGNIAHRLEFVRIMLERLQCNVFMLSYRGYGASDGYPSQHGITKDAQAALDHLSQRDDIDTSRIIVFGRSLGGAVGSVLARNNPDKVSALILENTFTSILDMAGVLLPFLKWFIGGSSSKGPKILNCFVRSPWNTIDVIGEVSANYLKSLVAGMESSSLSFKISIGKLDAYIKNYLIGFCTCSSNGHLNQLLPSWKSNVPPNDSCSYRTVMRIRSPQFEPSLTWQLWVPLALCINLRNVSTRDREHMSINSS